MASNKTYRWLFVVFILTLLHFVPSSGDDKGTLIKFRRSLTNGAALNNWNDSVDICNGRNPNWAGLICNKEGTIYGLRLENMALMGTIDVDALAEIATLRSFSVLNNSFSGPFPNVKKLRGLKALYLSYNKFLGEISGDAFEGLKHLKKVHLAENEFRGHLPTSLVELDRLVELNLEGNSFEGHIPDFKQKDFKVFNLSNNEFEGRIPDSLSNMDPSAFAGNKNLCGKPLEPCKPHKKRLVLMIVVVVVSVTAIATAISAIFIICLRRNRASGISKAQTKLDHPDRPADYKRAQNGDLHFVGKDKESFDLQDLLSAPAEVLGSGSFGSSYKALVFDGPAVVVKRFRQMNNAGKEEFYEHMKRLGKLSHPNILPLVAFYYRKEEKLLIYEYAENGSLASHLHANLGPREAGLDWPTRLKIIRGVARGLAYLYKEFPGLTLPHGHLKSSNVVLDHNYEPKLTEYTLVPVISRNHAQKYMAAYNAPEATQYDRTTKKTDVWCLGILILELLTGKLPANYLRHGKGTNADLATWVNSVVREEWTEEVFDTSMKGPRNGEGEMLKLLKIGLCCCEWGVEGRWDWREAVGRIEELKEKDSEEEYSSYASEGEVYSSKAMTEDDFCFSVTDTRTPQ